MAKANKQIDREELLAEIAEMYYQEGQTQAEISKEIGMTRSAISRMLTEARQKGIVEIHIHRPLRYHADLETKLAEKFNLRGAHVISWQNESRYGELKNRLGRAASFVLGELIKPNQIIGIAWGTTVQATIDAFEARKTNNMRVVQLLGVLGSTRHAYSGQALVERMAHKLNGEGIYLYTPFIVENENTAKYLRNDLSVHEAISLGQQCDIALLGVGSTKPEFCSLYQGGHITRKELTKIKQAKAVGDVSGHYFDISGKLADVDFHKRIIGITQEDLLKVPIRLGVAGSEEKAEAIFGALRGRYVNTLVTENITAAKVLELAESHGL